MATAAVIDFGSFSSPSNAERVPSLLGSYIERDKFVDSGCDPCPTEFDGIVGSSPALRTLRKILRQKPRLIQQRIRLRSERSRAFLSQAGPRVWIVVSQAEHHLVSFVCIRPTYDKGDPLGSPSLETAMQAIG